jgi:type IV secretion system protein VirB10
LAASDSAPDAAPERRSIPGDRGVAVVARSFASIQAKVRNALALGVVVLLGGGFLGWYYSGLAETRAEARQVKPQAVQGEMPLPPLGPAPAKPKVPAVAPSTTLVDADSAEASALLAGAGVPGSSGLAYAEGAAPANPYAYGYPSPPQAPAVDPVLQRRLEAPVLVRGSDSYQGTGVETLGAGEGLDGQGRPGVGSPGVVGSGRGSAAAQSQLGALLTPTRTAAVAAGLVPDRRWLLPKGSSIDCTLETAIDSTLPGMTSCVLATDVWSADGSVVLLERGTKLIGETRGGVQQGQKRLFVLWNDVRTPEGVAVELASPGTDALGRAGVTGEVDTQFGARFGAAILISLIDTAAAAIVAAQGEGGNNVVVSTRGAQDVVSEIVRESMDVAPVIRVPQGERIAVLVARDVDFSTVYALNGG